MRSVGAMSTDTATLNGMAQRQFSRFTVVVGGDDYLASQTVRDLAARARSKEPEAETMELDAGEAGRYDFDEAVSPSLLSSCSIVVISHLQKADDQLVDAMESYGRQLAKGEVSSVVVARHDGGQKGRKIIDRLVKAGAVKEQVPDLKRADAKLNFVLGCFEREGRRVDPAAAQQLVAVLGDRTGELAAMCSQLCFDFDDDPIGIDRVNQYLNSDPQVTGFAVADSAIAGNVAGAIVSMRSAVRQGIDPIALIGALAMKLRSMAKASAVRGGAISQAEARMAPWMFRNALKQLSGWTSQGLSACVQSLAEADEASKTSGGDPVYALERSISLIGAKGRM